LLLLTYMVASAAVVAAHLWQLRVDALTSGERLVTAFAQITDEQTARTLQAVDQTLQAINTRLALGSAQLPAADVMRQELNELLKTRPYLKGLFVIDTARRTVYESTVGNIGKDMSDRQYILESATHPDASFLVGAPVRSRFLGGWTIPALRAWRRPDGSLAGVIVAGVDPHFFDRVWTVNDDGGDFAIALLRDDGRLLFRSPFDEPSMSATVNASPIFKLIGTSNAGTFRHESLVDGKSRILAYRRLTSYPNLVLVVGASINQLLGDWRRTAWTLAFVWIAAAAIAGLFALSLTREWEARRATEQRYRLLFDANPYPVTVIDRATRRFLAVNDAAVRQYGWSREEQLAMSVDDIYPPGEMPRMTAQRLHGPLDATEVVSGLQHRRKDGTIIDVEIAGHAIDFDGRPAILTMAQDVTDRVRAEHQRSVAEEQLRQAQKMEAVGQLTGGIAHDFNNILSVILANVEAFEEKAALDPELTNRAGRIAKAVQRATDLVRQLLTFSRKQPLRPQPTDINELVGVTGNLLRRTLGEQIEINYALAEDLWTANVDRTQLETSLVNLCINARDAMPNGGKMLIETGNARLDEDYVARNGEAAAGDYVLIAITDTGVGMPPDVLARVFEPFFTTKPTGKGTGLGLSMVYGFIKQSNGHIKIYSEIGRGTAVKLYLPRSKATLAAADAAQRSAPLPRGSERILLVEDDAQVRDAVVMQLQSLGYAVTQAETGADGLAACAATELAFDLLLTDVIMRGGMNGRMLADEVSRRWPSTRIVFMSGYTENALAHNNGQLEAGVRLLNKPFHKAELAQMVRRTLDETIETGVGGIA
jgi:PAS domain S-box-containing protein